MIIFLLLINKTKFAFNFLEFRMHESFHFFLLSLNIFFDIVTFTNEKI